MDQAKYYMDLQADLSGSRSKNRFRAELLWGVSKMLELMETSDDFTIVFDYVCDIEIHKDNAFEFYQVKTHKASQPNYTSKSLTNYKSGQEGSILGKLFALNKTNDDAIKVVLVCNTPYKALTDEPTEMSLDELDEDNKSIIIKAIKEELGIDNIDLSKSFYLYTPMNLVSPHEQIKGELISTFERIKGSEPIRPNALFRLVFDTVSEKACYEFSISDYEELKELKGISRKEFDKMLDVHCSSEKTGVNATMEYIKSLSSIHERRTYSKALSTLIPKIAKSRKLQKMEVDMAKTLVAHPEVTTMEEALDLLTEEYHNAFSLEYDNAEKTVCYMLVIKKYEEGGYDNEIDI